MKPTLLAVEFENRGRVYRCQVNAAGYLQTKLCDKDGKTWEHVNHADHIEASQIGFRLFTAKGQKLDPEVVCR